MITEYQSWKIVRRIGNGKYGTVYEVEREDMGQVYRSALKLISIPPQDNDEMKTEAESSGNADEYYYQVANEIANEINIMYKLHGHTNIVNYEDHEVRKHKDGKGYDILIRMELLTPLDKYIKENSITRRDVIQLGIDICQALERCQKFNIMHRDIKPANILVSDFKEFKLGDFGIARVAEKHSSLEYSQKGTYNYMSPEIFHHKPYGFDVDMYSLGIVMYRLLNNNRLPFLPPYPEKITHEDRENALRRRMRGEKIPMPSEDQSRLAQIILKSCSYDPSDRYSSPTEMKEDLMTVFHSEGEQKNVTYNEDILHYNENASDTSRSDQKFRSDLLKKMKEYPDEISEGETVFLNGKELKSGKKQNLILQFVIPFFVLAALLAAFFFLRSFTDGKTETDSISGLSLIELINQKYFVEAYSIISTRTDEGENLDVEIKLLVEALLPESEYKRSVAAMRLLSDQITDNKDFYREMVAWFYTHDKEFAHQILTDLRKKSPEGEKLADSISLEYDDVKIETEE